MKKIRCAVMRVLVCTYLCVTAAGALFAAESGQGVVTAVSGVTVLSFDVFCERTVAYYPRLKTREATIGLAIARQWRAAMGLLPKVHAFTSMTTSDDQVYVFGTLLKQRAFTQSDFALSRLNDPASRTNYDIGVTAEMPLFDALQTVYRVRQAKHAVLSAQADAAFARMEAILLAADAYLRAIAIERTLAVADEACRSSEADIKQAEELKDKGMVLGADFYAAKVALGNLRMMRNDLLARQAGMHTLLNILMGEEPLTPLALSDTVQDHDAGAKSLSELLAEAYRLRPDLASLEEAIRGQEYEVSRERASALPSITAFGDLRENTQNFTTGGGSFAVGLKGSVDLFDADYFARVRIARESLRKLEYERAVTRDAIAKDLADEYMRLQALAANLPVFREMATDADQAVALTAPLYREGRKSIADLLEMRCARVRAHQGHDHAVIGLSASHARLLFLSGQIDEAAARQIIPGGEAR